MRIVSKESFIAFSKEAMQTAIDGAIGKPVTVESDGPKIGKIVKATIIEENGNDFVVEYEMEVEDLWI